MAREITTFNPDGSIAQVITPKEKPVRYHSEKKLALNPERLPGETQEFYRARLAIKRKVLKNIAKGRKLYQSKDFNPALGNRAARRKKA